MSQTTIPTGHLPCRGVPPPKLLLRNSLDDSSSSVLPTPPPLLLPGPRSPGLFGPITTPSFFATATNEPTARTAILVDSAATYPLTRIYLYGSEALVNTIMWALRSVCPLDRFQAKVKLFSFHSLYCVSIKKLHPAGEIDGSISIQMWDIPASNDVSL